MGGGADSFSASQLRTSSPQSESLGKKIDSLDSDVVADIFGAKENQAERPSLVEMVAAKANMILQNTLASAPTSNDRHMDLAYGAGSELNPNFDTGNLVNQLL